ncbi:MAG: IS3 family transposase [Bacilli bacterium]|nr:IS3 family transposase [Bacilli bacterium]
MIDSKLGFRLSTLLKAASLSRSTYYFEISKPDLDIKNQEIIDIIQSVFKENKSRYGVRRITAELNNQGIAINHKKVQRIMNKFGLKAIKTRVKYHSYIGEVGHIADNIINRDFKASKPNEKWTTDVSQFNCPFGKAYLSPILDMYGTDIVAWDLSLSPNLEQVKRMLDEAFRKNPNIEGLIFHSDMGWQYQHNYYQERLKEKGIIQSMSRKGNCIDNCIMETFFGTLKREMFYGHEQEFQTFEQLKQAIAEYIDYYNNKRIKGKTKWMPPVKFREASMLDL